MRCSECHYFKKVIDLNNVKNEAGACYLNPPIPQLLPTAQGIATASARPQVNASDFCSHFSDSYGKAR